MDLPPATPATVLPLLVDDPSRVDRAAAEAELGALAEYAEALRAYRGPELTAYIRGLYFPACGRDVMLRAIETRCRELYAVVCGRKPSLLEPVKIRRAAGSDAMDGAAAAGLASAFGELARRGQVRHLPAPGLAEALAELNSGPEPSIDDEPADE